MVVGQRLTKCAAITSDMEQGEGQRARCSVVGRRGGHLYTSEIEGVRLTVGKVEYIVVNYDENDPKVTLSLRQADILHSLAHDDELKEKGGCVPDLQDVASPK